MCGICGVIQLSGPPREVVEAHVLDRMTDAMSHRGPSDRGTILEPGIAIGVRRLSIVDVEGGHQPFANEDGSIWAAQNGELFNHESVRRDLRDRGHRFNSRCDTEILPHLYESFGTAFPEKLRGMFGIVLWDRNRRRTVLVRDRLGIKPLYYAVAGDLLVFASELKSLLASGLVGDELDHEAIDAYLTFGFFPAPATPLRQVRKLEPGHRLIVDPDGLPDRALLGLPDAVAGSGPPRPPRDDRGALRRAGRGRPPAPDVRRPPRRDAERRSRFEPDRRHDGPPLDRARSRPSRSASAARARSTSSPTPAASPAGSAPTTTRSRSASTRRRSIWRSSPGTWTSRSPTSRPSGSSRSASSPHATSRSPSPGRAPTSCWAAIASTAPRRSPTRGRRLPRPLGGPRRRCARARPRAAAAPRTDARERRPGRRATSR